MNKQNKNNYKYRSFEKARDYARKLGLKSKSDWFEWTKTDKKPENIPSVPASVYKNKGWNGWGDFLGTGTIASFNRKYRSFEEVKEYARKLKLKSQTEWRELAKTDKRPKDIPYSPDQTYKNKGWSGWGDFLGTGTIAPFNRNFLPFEEARDFARKLGLKSQTEWREWAKTDKRPKNISSAPVRTYKNKGWNGWGDFLGTNKIANKNIKFLSFEEARDYARKLGFKSQNEWHKWAKTDKKPEYIPSAADQTYKNKGWNGWGDWLGTGYIVPKNRKFRSFEEAKDYARKLGFKSKDEWCEWAKTDKKPEDIPSAPRQTYKDKGWNGWGDFLGTNRIANQKRKWITFEDARIFARSLNFMGKDDWTEWAKTRQRPDDIPAYPDEVYAKKGWSGWQDWLGLFNKWNTNNMRVFVASLIPYIDTLSPAGLFVLYQQNGLNIGNRNKAKSFMKVLLTGKFPKEELEKFVNREESLVDEFFSGNKTSLEEEKNTVDNINQPLSEYDLIFNEDNFPNIEPKDILASLDSQVFSNLDNEAIDFFIKEAVAKIWQKAFSEPEITFNQVQQNEAHGVYSNEVKQIFLEEYQQTKNLKIPSGYNFNYHPNLMQRYTAYIVKKRKRIGNWSGTGAGKTLSAILASRVINAHLTVICCPNNVVLNWEENIKEIYPDSICVSKTTIFKKNARKHQYLILHYEFFQHPSAQKNVLNLLEEHIVDFVIIDEIHFSRQRVKWKVSQRKQIVAEFLSEAATRNENIHVLGMSATPVINNLFEGKTLVELVTGVHHDELQTKPTIENCISLYQKFVSHGIRWLPQYKYQLHIHTEALDCSDQLSEIKNQSLTSSMVDLEIVLTKTKIPFILSNLQPKTIVYTHYIKNIQIPLQTAIEQKGWRVAIFTGENKLGLDEFIKGDADILIVSSCAGTGVDKLQLVCNRLIVNSLPWTHAEFKQLQGRIYRQGQIHNHVDIFIPLTYAILKNKGRWSWCESRWKRILSKKSISDAAVDGVILEEHIRTPAQAYKDAMQWLERLDRGEVYEIERKKISDSLPESKRMTVLKN